MTIVLAWWSAMLVIGIAVLPLTQLIFRKFEDKGWLFSKTLGLFITAWALWAANCTGVLTFTQRNAFLVIGVIAAVNYGAAAVVIHRRGAATLPAEDAAMQTAEADNAAAPQTANAGRSARAAAPADEGLLGNWRLIVIEELLFLGMLMLCVYIIGFRPEVYGTEKFMDYAFMTSMMRSLKMPFADPWYAGSPINYYYGGQYVAAFLTKLAGSSAGEGYTLARALVTTCSFVLPFALVRELMRTRLRKKNAADAAAAAAAAGSEADAAAAGEAGTAAAGEAGTAAATARKAGTAAATARKAGTAAVAGVDGAADAAKRDRSGLISALTGLFAGVAVAFCGNFHYVIYGIILPIVHKIQGTYYSFWFPDSTRYIGYDPDLPDKTIHEFPAYSSILGDLHAHYVNIMFVVTVTAVVCGWALKQDPKKKERLAFLRPEFIVIGFMTGAFRWTNFWDFPIYYVVCGSVIFFVLLRRYRRNLGRFVLTMLAIAAVMFGVGYVAAMPFTMTFDQISSEIGLTHSHSLLYQLAVLWGLPALCLAGYVVRLLMERARAKNMTAGSDPLSQNAAKNMTGGLTPLSHFATPDLIMLMIGLCAAGLVFLPEVIYVKDIYGGDHYRANTMFKLSYQAFILFGMFMPYVLVRGLALGARSLKAAKAAAGAAAQPVEAAADVLPAGRAATLLSGKPATQPQAAADASDQLAPAAEQPPAQLAPSRRAEILRITACAIGAAVLLLTAGYTIKGTHDWFGNIFDPDLRIHTDASVFVSEYFPSDFEAINYMNSSIEGQPTILEAPGDSYTDYERVSVATGLPTVAGWRVHEWLWRGQIVELDERIGDCDLIYTSQDVELVRALIEKYGISYIYVGNLERERYPELNEDVLAGLGKNVFSDGEGTYILKVGEDLPSAEAPVQTESAPQS